MKAIVYTQYGPPDVLQLKKIAKPTPTDNEVLIKIYATTVTPSCCMVRKGEPLWGRIFIGFRKPRNKTPGIELAGDIEAVGKNVKRMNYPRSKLRGIRNNCSELTVTQISHVPDRMDRLSAGPSATQQAAGNMTRFLFKRKNRRGDPLGRPRWESPRNALSSRPPPPGHQFRCA